MPRTKLFFLALAATVSAAPAQSETITRAVGFSDLDLSRPHDVRVLKQRIALATEAVCGSYASKSAEEADTVTACRAQVNAQVEPQLAAVLAGKAGRSASIGIAAPGS